MKIVQYDNLPYVSIMFNASKLNIEIQNLRSTSNQQAWATRGVLLF